MIIIIMIIISEFLLHHVGGGRLINEIFLVFPRAPSYNEHFVCSAAY